MDMKRALLRRAQLLGEGITGGAQMRGMALTGGKAGKRKVKKPRMKKGQGITGGCYNCPKMVLGGKKHAKQKMKRGGQVPPQLQSWMGHVAQVRAMHPDKPYKMVLKMASKSYKA